MDYSTKVLHAKSVLTFLLVVGSVRCSPLPLDPSSQPTSPTSTHLEPPMHENEISHEARHVFVEVNKQALDPSITSVQDSTDSSPEQESPLLSENSTSPYSIQHLGFTPTGFIDTLNDDANAHVTPPKIIEAKDNVEDKKQDEDVAAAAASTPKPKFISTDIIASQDAEADNDFPQPEGEPEEEYIGLEPDEPLKHIAEEISVISHELQDYVDHAKYSWKPIHDNIAKNIDDTVKSISDATNEAQKILDPIKYDISKNIKETIKSINDISDDIIKDEEPTKMEATAFDDEHINSADENINEDFEINVYKAEHVENDYELIDDAVEFIKYEAQSDTAVAKEDFANAMSAAMKVDPAFNSNTNLYEDFGETFEADIENKDENISENALEAVSLNSEISQDDSHNDAMLIEDTTEKTVLFEDLPQADQSALDIDHDQKHELDEETMNSLPKDLVEEEYLPEELPQADQPLEAKDQEDNNMYIEEVHGIPEEKLIDYVDTPKDIPEDPVEDVPEMNEEDSAPEFAATSLIPDVHHEDEYAHLEDLSEAAPENEEPHGDDKIGTDSPIESVEKESEISYDIPIDITQNGEISKDEEPISIIENKLALNNNADKDEIPDENFEDAYSIGDEHIDEEIPAINEDDTVNESEEPLDEVTETSPVVLSPSEDSLDEYVEEEIPEENVEDVQISGDEHVDDEVPEIKEDATVKQAEEPLEDTEASAVVPSTSEDSLDEYLDPVAGAPLPDRVITDHESTEYKTSPTEGIPLPKADYNDQVNPHQLSASDNEISVPEDLPPRQEQAWKAAPQPHSAGSIFGIVFGVLLSLTVLMGGLGFMIYQRRGQNHPKSLNSDNSDRGFAGSDSGRYIDADRVRVAYLNSDMPKMMNKVKEFMNKSKNNVNQFLPR